MSMSRSDFCQQLSISLQAAGKLTLELADPPRWSSLDQHLAGLWILPNWQREERLRHAALKRQGLPAAWQQSTLFYALLTHAKGLLLDSSASDRSRLVLRLRLPPQTLSSLPRAKPSGACSKQACSKAVNPLAGPLLGRLTAVLRCHGCC